MWLLTETKGKRHLKCGINLLMVNIDSFSAIVSQTYSTVGIIFTATHHLAGIVVVVKASASREEDPGFESRLRRDFFGVESYQ